MCVCVCVCVCVYSSFFFVGGVGTWPPIALTLVLNANMSCASAAFSSLLNPPR